MMKVGFNLLFLLFFSSIFMYNSGLLTRSSSMVLQNGMVSLSMSNKTIYKSKNLLMIESSEKFCKSVACYRVRPRHDGGPINNKFPGDNKCHFYFIDWYKCVDLSFNLLIFSHKNVLKFIFFLMFQLYSRSFFFILERLNKKILKSMELKKYGIISSYEAKGAKYVSKFVFFVNYYLNKMLLVMAKYSWKAEQKEYYMNFHESFCSYVKFPFTMKFKELMNFEDLEDNSKFNNY